MQNLTFSAVIYHILPIFLKKMILSIWKLRMNKI